MTPGRYILEFVQGDDAAVWFQLGTEDAATRAFAPDDLTGFAAKLYVRDAAGVTRLTVDSATAGELAIDGPAGTVSGYLPRAKTLLVGVAASHTWGLVTRGPAAGVKVTTELAGPCLCLAPPEAP